MGTQGYPCLTQAMQVHTPRAYARNAWPYASPAGTERKASAPWIRAPTAELGYVICGVDPGATSAATFPHVGRESYTLGTEICHTRI
jgi:hypothetical protein